MDYKTDFVNEENINQIIEKYKKTVDLYADIIETLTGKSVKENVYIYLELMKLFVISLYIN